MKVVFIDNLLLPEKGDLENLDIHPHLGLLSLLAVAQQNGHDASIIDPKRYIVRGDLDYDEHLYERFAKVLLDQSPDVVGFTTLGCSFIFALSVSDILKDLKPDLPILLGGPHATILHRKLLKRFEVFDIVVRNEAENTLVPVLEGLEEKKFDGIPGISWRSGNKVYENPGAPTIENVDQLIFPAYDTNPKIG